MARAGVEARRLVRREQIRFLRKNARLVLGWFVACAVAWGATSVFQPSPFWRGLWTGLWIGVFVGVIGYWLAAAGYAQRSAGAEAEKWTSEQLRKLDPRAWKVIDDVSFHDGNVDHVVVGAGSVLAVETKWTTQDLLSNGRATRTLRTHADRCRQGAERIARLLKSEGTPREVIPLLVYWGPGSHDLPDERFLIGNVRVVAGPKAAMWLGRLHDSALSIEFDLPAWRSLSAYVEKRDRHRASKR